MLTKEITKKSIYATLLSNPHEIPTHNIFKDCSQVLAFLPKWETFILH